MNAHLYLGLLPLPEAHLLHLKVDPLNVAALPLDLNAPHVPLKVVDEFSPLGVLPESLQTLVIRQVIHQVDYQDT